MKIVRLCRLIAIICWFSGLHGEGFVVDTLIHSANESKQIRELRVGDTILGYDFALFATVPVPIMASSCRCVNTVIHLELDNEDILELAENQLLFVPLQCGWLPARELEEGMYLFGSPLRAIKIRSVLCTSWFFKCGAFG